MKLTKIELGMAYRGYGEGAEPGIKCDVDLRIPGSYSNVTIKLTPEQVKDVVQRAVEHAVSQLTFDPETIDVEGSAGKPRPEPETLSFTTGPSAEDMPL